MKKTFLVVGVLVCAVVLGGLWFSRVPDDPIYQGKRLSEWLHDSRPPYTINEETEDAVRALDTKAIPWLLWAREHGRVTTLEFDSDDSIFDKVRHYFSGPPPPIFPGSMEANYYDERERALWGLFLIGQKNEKIIQLAKDLIGDSKDGWDAGLFLARAGDEEREFLIQTGRKGSHVARENALLSFDAMYSDLDDAGRNALVEKAMPVILQAMKDPAPALRATAAYEYSETPDCSARRNSYAEVLPILIEMLSEQEMQARQGACCSLESMGTDAAPAVSQLIALLEDPEPNIRARSAAALGKIDLTEQRSKEALLKAADSPGEMKCRTAAARALSEFGIRPRLIDELIGQMGSDDDETREEAMEGLAAIGPAAAEAMPKILDALERYDTTYPGVIRQLDQFGTEASIPYLIQALSHPVPEVRALAAEVFAAKLTDRKEPEIEAALAKLYQDPDNGVREKMKWVQKRRIRGTPLKWE